MLRLNELWESDLFYPSPTMQLLPLLLLLALLLLRLLLRLGNDLIYVWFVKAVYPSFVQIDSLIASMRWYFFCYWVVIDTHPYTVVFVRLSLTCKYRRHVDDDLLCRCNR